MSLCGRVIILQWVKQIHYIGLDRLDSKAIMEAVRSENACNPIVHSATKSYLRVAQRYICIKFQLRAIVIILE